MKSSFFLLVITSGLLASLFLFTPQGFIHAQDGECFDAAGESIACPPVEEKPDEQEKTLTHTPVPSTFTPTPTNTLTATTTSTATATSTATNVPDTATPTITPTSTSTPTPTPVPVTQSVLPGAGLGALILFLIVWALLPAIQKLRVAKRGY